MLLVILVALIIVIIVIIAMTTKGGKNRKEKGLLYRTAGGRAAWKEDTDLSLLFLFFYVPLFNFFILIFP